MSLWSQGENYYVLEIPAINGHLSENQSSGIPGRVAQLVTCLTTDAYLTADPGVTSLILARPHTFAEIDQEIISTVILLHSAE